MAESEVAGLVFFFVVSDVAVKRLSGYPLCSRMDVVSVCRTTLQEVN